MDPLSFYLGTIRPRWSNLAHANSPTDPGDQYPDWYLKEAGIPALTAYARKCCSYPHYSYTADSPLQLWDTMRPAPECWLNMAGGTLRDDCDGIHAAMGWGIRKVYPNWVLLTAACLPLGNSHTVLAIPELWWLVDYTKVVECNSFVGAVDYLKNRRKGTKLLGTNINTWDPVGAKWT